MKENRGDKSGICDYIDADNECVLTPLWRAVQCMYERYSGSLAGWYTVCTAEVILDNCFTERVFCGLSCFPFGCIIF